MTLLTTERLLWQCGTHTAEPNTGDISPIPPIPYYQNLLFSVAREGGRSPSAELINRGAASECMCSLRLSHWHFGQGWAGYSGSCKGGAGRDRAWQEGACKKKTHVVARPSSCQRSRSIGGWRSRV